MRIGVIDIGSNTIKTSVFTISDGRTDEIFSKTIHAKLSSHVKDESLTKKGTHILIKSLCDLRRTARKMGCKRKNIYSFATACIRGVDNRYEILDLAKRCTKLKIELLDGESEAELCFLGALASKGCPKDGILADLGGGSCEFVSFRAGKSVNALSLNVGALVMHRCFSSGKYISRTENEGLADHLKNIFTKEVSALSADGSFPLIVTGGSARAAVKLLSLLDKRDPSLPFEISVKRAEELCDSFFNGELSDIYEKILSDRAQTLIPALTVFIEASKAVGSESFTVIDGGARLGVAKKILSQRKG